MPVVYPAGTRMVARYFFRFRNAVIASRASSLANSRALSVAISSPWASIRATRSRLRIAFDSRRPWAAPVASGRRPGDLLVQIGRRARPA